MNRWTQAALVAVAVLGVGCAAGGPQEATWEGEAKSYAVYATQIPLYPGAKVEDVMGSDSFGDTEAGHTEGMAFWFAVSATRTELDGWYAERLTGATKTIDDEGAIIYTLAPEGGEAGEEVGVVLEENRLRVFEQTKAGKHRS